MNVDTTLHLGEVLILFGSFFAILKYLHNFDKLMATRHVTNDARLNEIKTFIENVRDDVYDGRTKLSEIDKKLSEIDKDVAILKRRH